MRSIAITATNATNGATYANVARESEVGAEDMTQVSGGVPFKAPSIVPNYTARRSYNVGQHAVESALYHDAGRQFRGRPAHYLDRGRFHRQERQPSRL